MSLLRRVVLIVLVALLPALAAEIYNQRELRAAQRVELDDEAVRVAQSVAAELGRILDGTRNAMIALAAMPAIQDEDAPACTRLLHGIGTRFEAINVLALVNGRDQVVCSSLSSQAPPVPSGPFIHVRLARQRGGFAVAGYLFGRRSHEAELATGMPVRPAAGPPASVLIADIGLDWLGRQMRGLATQSAARITIIDRNGLIVASVPDGPAPGTASSGFERGLLDGPRTRLVRETAADGGSRPLAIARMPDLTVFVRLDRSRAAAAQERAALRSYVTFGAGLLLALACAILLARRAVATPVARILRTIARWRGGDATARVAMHDAQSELGRIGRALDDLLGAFERTAERLLANKAELEQRVAERTRQLEAEIHEREQTQAQLQQAQKMEVIGQLTGGVAHDFNNLLTAIIGNLELGRLRSQDRPEVARLLDNAMRAADRGAALTQRMLAFGRRQFLRLQPIDVAALLGGMDDLLTRSIGPTVTLSVRTEPGLWPARADANQIELALLNIAINARDAMPQGGSLAIAASNETVRAGDADPARLHPGDYVRISLQDSGIGMDRATLERVLEPFFTTKPAGKGSGLGLSMAQGVAAQSGGGLAIESRVGEGSTVSMWLPREIAGAEAEDETAPDGEERAALTPGSGEAILLVDDDPEVAEVARQCLVDEGYAVLHAPDGAAALALLDGGVAIALLIADLAMPGMNGLQLAARARTRRPGLPVLLATGYAETAAIHGSNPGYPVLEKPFKVAQLLEAVAGLLGPHAVGDG